MATAGIHRPADCIVACGQTAFHKILIHHKVDYLQDERNDLLWVIKANTRS